MIATLTGIFGVEHLTLAEDVVQKAIPNLKSLESYYLFHAVMGDLELQLNHLPITAAHFQRALQLVEMPPERKFLEKRLQACE